MITIGPLYTEAVEDQVHLCARVSIHDRSHIPVTPAMERRARILSAAARATGNYFNGKGTDIPFAWK